MPNFRENIGFYVFMAFGLFCIYMWYATKHEEWLRAHPNKPYPATINENNVP